MNFHLPNSLWNNLYRLRDWRIYASVKYVIVVSESGFSPVWYQVITRTNSHILSFEFKYSNFHSGKWRLTCRCEMAGILSRSERIHKAPSFVISESYLRQLWFWHEFNILCFELCFNRYSVLLNLIITHIIDLVLCLWWILLIYLSTYPP